jgi:hypothetical protein
LPALIPGKTNTQSIEYFLKKNPLYGAMGRGGGYFTVSAPDYGNTNPNQIDLWKAILDAIKKTPIK